MNYWNGYARFYDWEFQLICSEQKHDVLLWLDLASRYGDPILEYACGSGRITLQLLEQGYQITAVDSSEIMLNLLKNKACAYHSLTCVNADLTDFTEKIKHNLIIISYSSFQQLLTRKQQLQCLRNIRGQLSPQGVLGIDVGQKICDGNDVPEYRLLFKAWHPEICSEVEMYTSWITDKSNKIRYWTDKYCWIDKQGNNRQFINKIALKECNRQYLEQLVLDSDLKIKSVYGSFLMDSVSSDSTNIIYLIGKN